MFTSKNTTMKKLDGMNKKETSRGAKKNVKSYIPQHIDNKNNSETENTSLDASLEAAIEELKEIAPQNWSDEGDSSSSTSTTQGQSQQHKTYTPAQIEAIEDDIETTKGSILSADSQWNEWILPTIILPSKLKELYEKEAFIRNQKD